MSDLRLYRAAKARWNIAKDLHYCQRKYFVAWRSQQRQEKRARQQALMQNGIVKRFRNRACYRCFRAWRELSSQMAKIKKFMRHHMASGLRRCWDEWMALVRAQKGEREAKLKRFIFRIKYRMVGRCFASLVLNVRQNAITRRFLFLMHAACVVNTFEAWYGERRGVGSGKECVGGGATTTRVPACACSKLPLSLVPPLSLPYSLLSLPPLSDLLPSPLSPLLSPSLALLGSNSSTATAKCASGSSVGYGAASNRLRR